MRPDALTDNSEGIDPDAIVTGPTGVTRGGTALTG